MSQCTAPKPYRDLSPLVSAYGLDERPRRYVSAEHMVQIALMMESLLATVQGIDYERACEEVQIQTTRASAVPDALYDYLEIQRVLSRAYRPADRLRWLVWRDVRVRRYTSREAASAHNTRVKAAEVKVYISKTTAGAWTSWVDALVEKELRRRGMLVRGAVGTEEYANVIR